MKTNKHTLIWLAIAGVLMFAGARPGTATFCVTPITPQETPQNPPSPQCYPQGCKKCTASPCYLSSGIYANDFADLQIRTAGGFPLTVARHYDTSRLSDGPFGIGWTGSVTARLYYAVYLFSAPNTYTHEADVLMLDGTLFRFTMNPDGTFVTPPGRRDTLIRNVDGTFSMTLGQTRSKFAFAVDGSLTSMTDDYGNAITITYDGSGRVQHIADAAGSGRYLDVTWDTSSGRITQVTDSAARQIKYFYDTTSGLLTGVSNPAASAASTQSTYYTYVPGRFAPLLSRVEDQWHRVISQLAWYPTDKLQSYTEGSYDDSNPPSSTGEKYLYTYSSDSSGQLTRRSHSLGSVDYRYDIFGLVTTGGSAQYDSNGRVTTAYTDTGTVGYEYDTNGNVTKVTQGDVVWNYTYDVTFPDKVASIIPKDQYGILRTNWAGRQYEYFGLNDPTPGALKKVLQVRSDTTTADTVANYTYDSHGRVLTATDLNNVTTTYTHNGSGDLETLYTWAGPPRQFSYDSLGRITQVTDPMGNATTYTYDLLDRPLTVTLPKPAGSSILDFTTHYSYDNYDSTTGLTFTNVTDPNGRVSRSGSDALGHIVQSVDALGNITQFTYQYNVLKKIRDGNGNETLYTYDPSRNLSATTFPDGTMETYVLGLSGTLFSSVDRHGQQVQYTYDSFGRVSTALYPGLVSSGGGSVGTFYTYDGQKLAQISYQTPSAGPIHNFTYDTSWRLSTDTILGGEKITYTYPSGYSTPIALPSEVKIEPAYGSPDPSQTMDYTYDGAGRVASVSWSWIPNYPFYFAYNGRGQYSVIVFPSGQTRSYAYDNQGRLTQVANSHPTTGNLATYTYTYDYDWSTATYTMLGQRTGVLVNALPAAGQTGGTTTYTYDGLYRLIRADYPSSTYEAWTYDAIGNRTSKRYISGAIFPYTYYTNGSNPNNGQRLRNDSAGPDFTYDPNGNLTGRVGSTSVTWDFANRVSSYTPTTYLYDYLSRRTTATAAGVTTRYVSLELHTVGERNSSGVVNDYLFGPGIDEPLAKRAADGTISYYSADGRGSIVAVTNSTGTILSGQRYSPWGEGAVSQLFGYAGRETGGPAWFYRARYYDAGTGRFLSEDPLHEYTHTLVTGLYSYVAGNPVAYDDPMGLSADCCYPQRCVDSIQRGIAIQMDKSFGQYWKFLNSSTSGPQAGGGNPSFYPGTEQAPNNAKGGVPFVLQDCWWQKVLRYTTYWRRENVIVTHCTCPDRTMTSKQNQDFTTENEYPIGSPSVSVGRWAPPLMPVPCPSPQEIGWN